MQDDQRLAGSLAAVGSTTMRFIVLLLGLSLPGCSGGHDFVFGPTEATQEVVFLTTPAAGGPGKPVYTSPDLDQALRYQGLRVCLLADAQKLIRNRLGPRPESNHKVNRHAMTVVHAKVHLAPAKATVTSNPPSKVDVYEVVIEELIDAKWNAP